MELNTLYKLKITTSYRVKRIKEILTFKIGLKNGLNYSKSGGLELKKSKDLVFILIKRTKHGSSIGYFCNWVYGVGEFCLVSDKDLSSLFKYGAVAFKKDYQEKNWRYFRYKNEISNEFIHPIDEVEKQLNTANFKLISAQIEVDRLEEKKTLILNKFK